MCVKLFFVKYNCIIFEIKKLLMNNYNENKVYKIFLKICFLIFIKFLSGICIFLMYIWNCGREG